VSLDRPTRGGPAHAHEVGQAVDHEANEVVVREGGARPLYELASATPGLVRHGSGESVGDRTIPLTIDTAGLPMAAVASEQLLANSLDFTGHDRLTVALVAPPAGATTHTSFDFDVYVWSDGPGWLLAGSFSGVALGEENVVLTRYRRAYVRITAAAGGVNGDVLLWVGGIGSPSRPSIYRRG